MEDVNVTMLARTTIDALLPSMRDKKLKLDWASGDKCFTNVKGDPLRLQQVFNNLLTNAIKFTPQGGLIRVAVTNSTSHVTVQVSDTGKGISRLPPTRLRALSAGRYVDNAVDGRLGAGIGDFAPFGRNAWRNASRRESGSRARCHV